MTKILKKTIIFMSIVIILGLLCFVIDFVRAKNQQEPIFCIRKTIYRDGGTKEFYGLGYKVIFFNKFLNDGSKFKRVVIGNWNIQYKDYEEQWNNSELKFKDIELYNNLTGYMSSTNTDFEEGREILRILENLEFNEEINKNLENNYIIEISNESTITYYIKSNDNYVEKDGKMGKISNEDLKILKAYIDKLINKYQMKFDTKSIS